MVTLTLDFRCFTHTRSKQESLWHCRAISCKSMLPHHRANAMHGSIQISYLISLCMQEGLGWYNAGA